MFLVTNPVVISPPDFVPVEYSVVTTVVEITVVTGVPVVVSGAVLLEPVEHGTVVVIVLGEHPEVVSPAEFVPVEQTVVVIVVVDGVVTEVTVVVIVLGEHPEVVSPAEFVPVEQTVVVIVVVDGVVTEVTVVVGITVVSVIVEETVVSLLLPGC